MKRSMAALLGIFMIGIMTAVVPLARADDHSIDNQGNRIVLSNGSLTAEFEGMVPKVIFHDTNGMVRTEQKVNFRALIEYNDADNNGLFESNERVVGLILDEAGWTHTQFYTLPGSSGVGINFTLAGTPNVVSASDGHTVATLQPGSIVLVVKAYNVTTKINTPDGKSFTVGKAEIKFDIVIANWPFQNTTDKLALQVNMHSSTEHFDNQGQDIDASHDEGAQTTEHELHQTSDVEQEVKFSSGLITTSSTIGDFRFVNQATVTSPSGQSQSVPVKASFKSETENDGGDKETFMKLYLSYPNFQGTVVHDPSISLGPGFPTLYLIVGGAAVAVLLAVVAIRRRHPRVQKDSGHN